MVDGFASAGRYRTGEPGSPLISLEAYLGRDDLARLTAKPHYFFIEEKRIYVRHLTAEVGALKLGTVEVDILKGQYEERFDEVVERLVRLGSPPTFAFVDPYGYSDSPFDRLVALKRTVPKAEAMVYLPATHMARFAATGQTAAALTKEFGGESWKDAQDAESRLAKAEALKDIFYWQMKEVFDWVTAFRIEPRGGNAYYLVFGTGHRQGLRRMKEAMWTIDDMAGEGYVYTPPVEEPEFEQPQLLGMEDPEAVGIDHGLVLRELLRAHFREDEFSIDDAADYTLTRTKYIDTKHLRTMTLKRAEDDDALEVTDAKQGRRRGTYPEGTRMRFVDPKRPREP